MTNATDFGYEMKVDIMETALKLAIETYATLSGYTEEKVLKLIQDGDEVVTRTVQMLMFVSAKA